ncbi:HWE histidine kinase domain-containing protein [Sphingomicrobium astaxanthinifaciens]|uniref:HWE histidine kinase domain-containing protein n=1 Tax=Sphingomicrobium astaxanthinifaciens TaxID=1227949 RepID=UPI001FCC0F88|nr:HWE histidine kinase domain-containing protein [Sphingomicrobium astaxanthinifaciens]MCJ7421937.1 GAF domain-containing protein [Sphingomicrobium astaxanthinifaciens]
MNKAEDFEGPVDLTNCDREPIHLLGGIQPVGFLIAFSIDWQVMRYSANLGDFLPVGDDPLGKRAQEFLSGEAIHALRNRLALLRGPDAIERLFRLCLNDDDPQRYDIALHMSQGMIVMEGEPSREKEYGDASGMVRSMVSRLDSAPDMDGFLREAARQVRALTGYDRVMVYRFDPDGSGEVVAEAAKNGIGTFLGLHYPASDIPRQARALYLRSLMRVITDVDAEPVPVLPATDGEGEPIDLSLSVLRSVSPIHIEYLKNMGVQATLTLSIITDNQLWGMVVAHHYSPRCPGFERRAVAELFGQLFAMRVESRERQALMALERQAREMSNQLLGAIATDESLLRDPQWFSDIVTGVVPADGVAVWINGNYAFAGRTPDTQQFARIVQALNGTAAGRVFATDRIADVVDGAETYSGTAAGMLAIPISRTPRDYVVLFREERVRSVRWAGNPQKPASFGPNGKRLHPRESFAEWKETVEGRSRPFSETEKRIAETLRATLIEVVLRLSDEASVERQAANDRQELLIAELNHRVRNILSLIRGLIRQSKPSDDTSIEEFVTMVDGRIHALARAHNQITEDHWGPAQFQQLIDAEVAAFLVEHKDRVSTDGPGILLNPQAYSTMALVIHELVTNSAKYGSLSTSGTVHLDWHVDETDHLNIRWTEQGGPPVQPPRRQGFGTTIIERSVPYDLGGKARLDYLPEGVRASFIIPPRHLTLRSGKEGQQARAGSATAPHAAAPDPRAGVNERLLEARTVLLVEDSLIIALDAEDILYRLGALHVATEATVEGALAAIDRARPDFAVLDINLGDATSFRIADLLEDEAIPFVFATGYGEQASLPERHRARAVLQKPYTIGTVSRRLEELLAAGN